MDKRTRDGIATAKEFVMAVGRWWFFVIGWMAFVAIGNIQTICQQWTTPGWVWGALFPVGLVVAVFIAYHKLRLQRDDARDKLAAATACASFASLLRDRRTAIDKIVPLGPDKDSLRSAWRQLENEQKTVIQLLHRSDNPWKHAPLDWRQLSSSLVEWAGLSAVMESRYPGQISPEAVSHNKRAPGVEMVEVNVDSFAMIRGHASDLVNLIAKEIETPDQPKTIEPADTFSQRVAMFPST